MILSLNYLNLAGTVQQTNKLCDELAQYCDELNRKVQKKMYSVEGGMSSHLNNADYYVNNKIKKLREKQENAYNISKRVSELLSTAQRVDEDVARLIENRQKEFFKENPDLKTPLYQSVIQGLIGTTPLGSFLLGLSLFNHFNPIEELQKNIKNSFKSAFNPAQNYVDNISDKVSSTAKNVLDKEDKKSTGNVLAVAGILAGANSVKSWASDLITSIKDFWQKHWGTITATSTTEAVQESKQEKLDRLKEWSQDKNNIQLQIKNIVGNVGHCHIAAHVNLLRRKMVYDNVNGAIFTPDDVYKASGSKQFKYVSTDNKNVYYNVKDSHAEKVWTGNINISNSDGTVSYKMHNYYSGEILRKSGEVQQIPPLEDFIKQDNYSSIDEMFVSLLNAHPEGIAVHAAYGGTGVHAIVITDYYIEDGQYKFSIVDSVGQYVGSFGKTSSYSKSIWGDWYAFLSRIDYISYIE